MREIKADIAKPVRSQPFEKRRVIIDQTAKLNSNINYLVASDNRAIAVAWDANAGRPNYSHRKEHLARDGKIYVLRDGWAYRQGLITRGGRDLRGHGRLWGKALLHLPGPLPLPPRPAARRHADGKSPQSVGQTIGDHHAFQ